TFFANGTCASTGTGAGTITLASGSATSNSEGPLVAGPYSFQATYNGDSNYLPSTGTCEPFTVTPGNVGITTVVQLAGTTVTSVPFGSTVTDLATVTGTGAGTPTGTVTFTFFTNGTCAGKGTAAGTITLASGSATSNAEGPLTAVGSDSFQATYNGDSNYLSATGACEPFTVGRAPSTTVTSVQLAGTTVTSVPLGSTVTDLATVTGAAGTSTGTVTFTYFTNGTCATTGTSAGTISLVAGSASSNSEGPLVAGSYSFQATYNGDGTYASSTGTCEPFTVTMASSSTVTSVQLGGKTVTSVTQGATVTDLATVTGTGAGTPTGTVTFTFFTNGTCTATGTSAGTVSLVSGSATSNSEGPLTAVGTDSFQATYNGDGNYTGSTGKCEPFTVVPPVSTVLTATASAAVVNNGTSVTFTYTEKNTGGVGITAVTVTGSACSPTTFVSSSDGTIATLDPGATWTYTCTTTLTNSTSKVIKVTDSVKATGTAGGGPAPNETAKVTVKVKPGPPPCGISITVSPNPLVETGQSEVHAVVQVEACPSFAGDPVNIDSSQLTDSCATVAFGTLQPGTHSPTNSIQVVLDDDGNVTVSLTGFDCAPGSSVIEADLVKAPFLTAVTTLVAQAPNVTPVGVVGYPANEVETGDTPASGTSDVYAVFYVETDPVYAETTAEISSAQLASRCAGGVTWTSNQGTSTGATATATLDDDGNAVFAFAGASCAPGTSTVIAEILAGGHTTYTSTYTTQPPMVTPS
ncbi:MAG TPA: Ig-like domain repeat protein, partial [Acidimicrobiales bacterium]|nr:Ig-like domain repeat protein [Acidimicrobiales bacterium]